MNDHGPGLGVTLSNPQAAITSNPPWPGSEAALAAKQQSKSKRTSAETSSKTV